ncbi:sugar-binding domain-containing protein [Clostridium oryzae]|uniref:beta-galactosidase n=1 Tax=Clostridium oryzae TaxID=1450648 RepID=A0A1V4IN88_9CLOT|nr:sugar-binding domain-containing protein [Clostridium oryzae]OPJ60957.1 beta-galactosidase [Clostridium oryzae]
MYKSIDLSGSWDFQLDEEKAGLKLPFSDTMTLPGTTSYYKKGKKNKNAEIGCLTDEYKFEGYAWFSKKIEVSAEFTGKNCFLYLERTRVTTVWIDDERVGTESSLCTPHIYNVTKYISAGEHTIKILVDNTDYPTKGGHLTSPDTQTNWNGITGRIELQFFNRAHLKDVQLYPDVKNKSAVVKANVVGANGGSFVISMESFNSAESYIEKEQKFDFSGNEISITYKLSDKALLWSEYNPNLYNVKLELVIDGEVADTYKTIFGLREFKAEGDKFTINGEKTFLRGKHDGLIFPLTGFAPTTVEEWLKVLKISKSYGINHYRFHTCCPPEAAFEAADLLGIYMEPELPFWGTVTARTDENHNEKEQSFLVEEGFRILKSFGNHPSFVMMSMGNELWGSRERINEILGGYRKFDNRHLYTEGSNNFQFSPVILENEDFFCGVRFAKNRLIRGSYAMCDAPLGHVQVGEPNTLRDYDEHIHPAEINSDGKASSNSENTIEIQYGTTVKKVSAGEYDENIIPKVPVVSHEIGQYATFPNFNEIKKYTGSIKAKNFEIFKERLEKKGLGDLAEKYFNCSGKLAMACYKEELEAAFRSRKMAGFQILDLQDFAGQGTALVGVLDAFMDSKGLISDKEWKTFCSAAVLMARFEKYNYAAGENFKAHVELSYYKNVPLKNLNVLWKLKDEEQTYKEGKLTVSELENSNYIDIGDIEIAMPNVASMKKLKLQLEVDGTDIEKYYDLWIYPKNISVDKTGINIFNELSKEAETLLKNGENVVLLPTLENLKNSIEGFYCTDFWCYPMFRSISESMNKEVPVGTMGLLIDNNHPIFKDFYSEEYSTYQWWNIVTNSRSVIMDDTAKEFRPIVQTIDNFERNHKLGLMFECKVNKGKVFVCSCDFDKIIDKPEGKQLLYSILKYVRSGEFNPNIELDADALKNLLK